MKQSPSNPDHLKLPRALGVLVAAAFLVAGCSSMEMSGGSSGSSSGSGMPGGVSLPGGGSSGGGASGGGTPPGGGSSGGMEGGMEGGSSGGASGGSSGGASGGSSGGGAGGISGPMESVEIPGGTGAGQEPCDTGGVSGGGIGGGMGCDPDRAGDVGQFPGGDAERAEQLGKELDESVGDFDEVLMEEQREIETVGRNTEGFDGTGGAGGRVSLGEQSAGAMSGGSSGGGDGGGGGGGTGSNDPLAGMSDDEVAKRTPDDIEVVIDDDIVAKQLREAALAEDDPVLRDRLWEEYRKYKGM